MSYMVGGAMLHLTIRLKYTLLTGIKHSIRPKPAQEICPNFGLDSLIAIVHREIPAIDDAQRIQKD